ARPTSARSARFGNAPAAAAGGRRGDAGPQDEKGDGGDRLEPDCGPDRLAHPRDAALAAGVHVGILGRQAAAAAARAGGEGGSVCGPALIEWWSIGTASCERPSPRPSP